MYYEVYDQLDNNVILINDKGRIVIGSTYV